MSTLSCQTDSRREVVRNHSGWNGLDFVEVDNAQTMLTVFFLGRAPEGITKDNLRIDGGRTSKDRVQVVAIDVQRSDSDYEDDRLLVQVDKPGDHSTYTLHLVGLANIDPRYASVEFSFKANCPTDLDCAPAGQCAPEVLPRPAIDYLAKDYAGFRQLILDRLSLICPDWRERHAADLGIALVEVLAYTGDYLSYYQDAVATEAYLDTARRRPSVRRHARLVDYTLSEGCNARALVALETGTDLHFSSEDVVFITGVNHLISTGDRVALEARELQGLSAQAYEVFEPVGPRTELFVWKAHNRIRFYTWGARECCIRKGANKASLWGRLANTNPPGTPPGTARKEEGGPEQGSTAPVVHLQPGSLLIFEEVLGPVTGQPGDADPRHRQAVRLTRVTPSRDVLLGEPVIEIEWDEADALRFDLCISTVGTPNCQYLEDISIARGNVILVDHGRRVSPEDLGTVGFRSTTPRCECEGQPSETVRIASRYRPQLKSAPLTFAAPFNPKGPAVELFQPEPRDALPVVSLSSEEGPWVPRGDLLSSAGDDKHFVVEMEENGIANLRFGDGELGRQPTGGSRFTAHYRIGNGPAGNVGAGAIRVLVHRNSNLGNDLQRVWNPLPAQGGTAPEPMAEAKLHAPHAFRYGPRALQRAITPEDYARLAERHAKIQRAAARLVWTGSWYEAQVGLDVKAAYVSDTSTIDAEITAFLEDYRRIGHDLDVRPAELVPVDLSLEVCIAPGYLRGHIKAALLDAFSKRTLPGGRLGFFHPDRLTFGDDIYLSAIVATAQAIPGVVSVKVKRLQRQGSPPNQEIERGALPLGPFQIARLDNDPNQPDQGRLEIRVVGGR